MIELLVFKIKPIYRIACHCSHPKKYCLYFYCEVLKYLERKYKSLFRMRILSLHSYASKLNLAC